jgi:hypothetical protein
MTLDNKFFHYTDLRTLALILQNGTIRFNRLDKVDDIEETERFGLFYLSKYIFVSCWTYSNDEIIPMWDRYARGTAGLIVTLPRDPFYYRPLQPNPDLGVILNGVIFSFFPLEKLFTDTYMVNATFLFNKDLFIKRMEYVDYSELKNLRDQAVTINTSIQGLFSLKVKGPDYLAGYKRKDWEYQHEVRYILQVYPTPPLSKAGKRDRTWHELLPSYVKKAFDEGKDLNIDFIDVELDPNAVDNIEVILSPFAGEPEKILVESLLEKFTKNGKYYPSSLTNKIK